MHQNKKKKIVLGIGQFSKAYVLILKKSTYSIKYILLI